MPTYTWGAGGAYTFAANSILNGCAIANAGVSDDVILALVQAAVPATGSLWRMDEASWGTVLDSGPAHRNGTKNGTPAPYPTAGWINNGGYWAPDANKSYVSVANSGLTTQGTIEGWIRYDATGYQRVIYSERWSLWAGQFGGKIRCVWGGTDLMSDTTPIVNGSWFHYSANRDAASGGQLRLYFNGTLCGSVGCSASATNSYAGNIGNTCEGSGDNYAMDGMIDELIVSSTVLRTANFSPGRYPASGTCVLQHGLSGTQVLSSIAWDATVGASYGTVSKVEVNTGSNGVPNWVDVTAASPITGGWAVPSQCVRFTLTPKSDALKSASPTLLSATLQCAPLLAGARRFNQGILMPYSNPGVM